MPELSAGAQLLQPRPWLAPLGRLYLWAARAHHLAYDRGWRTARRAPRPVVSIGNLTAGGSGKTPVTAWLAQRLAARGIAVGIVSRGYGGRRHDDPLVVARAGRLLAGPEEAGDEPVWLARAAPARAVVVARDRARGAEIAADLGAEVLLLDDGFQHRRLARALDLLILDFERPFGDGRGLPAGLLREPPAAAARAGLILLGGAPQALAGSERFLEEPDWPAVLRSALARAARRPRVAAFRVAPERLRMPDGELRDPAVIARKSVVAVSGIARPERFAATLAALGARVAAHLAFPDHHRYRPRDIERMARTLQATAAEFVVTTAKDAVRWPPGAPPAAVLEIGVRCGAEAEIVAMVEAAVRGAAGE